jgi:hypothetical protein
MDNWTKVSAILWYRSTKIMRLESRQHRDNGESSHYSQATTEFVPLRPQSSDRRYGQLHGSRRTVPPE